MNGNNLRLIAGDIRAEMTLFDMGSIGDLTCGTPGCIMGFTIRRFEIELSGVEEQEEILQICGDPLGLTLSQARRLFMPESDEGGFYWAADDNQEEHITAEHAARCCEYAAEHGAIDWHATLPEKGA